MADTFGIEAAERDVEQAEARLQTAKMILAARQNEAHTTLMAEREANQLPFERGLRARVS